jgi:hypothetical protein
MLCLVAVSRVPLPQIACGRGWRKLRPRVALSVGLAWRFASASGGENFGPDTDEEVTMVFMVFRGPLVQVSADDCGVRHVRETPWRRCCAPACHRPLASLVNRGGTGGAEQCRAVSSSDDQSCRQRLRGHRQRNGHHHDRARRRSLFGLECEEGFASPVHSPEGSVRLSDTLPVDPIDNTLASLQFPSIGRS